MAIPAEPVEMSNIGRGTCVVCFIEVDPVFGHHIEHKVCQACLDVIKATADPKCPSCRAPIVVARQEPETYIDHYGRERIRQPGLGSRPKDYIPHSPRTHV